MINPIPVLDLFSGPGGLAEGFASFCTSQGVPPFRIALSIEMDATAHKTLQLRAFLRKFESGFPPEYYDFLNGTVVQEPDWALLYPQEWQESIDETKCLELGTQVATSFLVKTISEIRRRHGGRTVLLGGPPCQSYSVVGRARNISNAKYDPDKDERQLLYQEYVKVLSMLQPAIAVLENVKGMLSAKQNGKLIFPKVMTSLTHAGGSDRYRLFSLSPTCGALSWDEGLNPKDFLIRAEEHGVPQNRHRVFVICIRSDIADSLPRNLLPKLSISETKTSVDDVIGMMPKLRSRLSKNDCDDRWRNALRGAHTLVQTHRPKMEQDIEERFLRILSQVRESAEGNVPPCRDAVGRTELGSACSRSLREWIIDRNITRLPNNDTRGHIESDLARYLFASAFGVAYGRSPRAADFPRELAAKHKSWNTGKFDDRFRVQLRTTPSTTITSHISKDGHYFIHPDPAQCRSLTVREAARLQTFPDNYFFHGGRTQQYVQVGNAVPPYLARQIAERIWSVLDHQFGSTAGSQLSVARESAPTIGEPQYSN